MTYKKSIFALTLITLLISTKFVSASGYIPADTVDTSLPVEIQQEELRERQYVYGQAIFNGRRSEYGQINFCVTSCNKKKLVKLEKNTLTIFKGKSRQNLRDNLYHCDTPNKKVQTTLERTDMIALIQYINRRFELFLK